ncbi:hypothetical protein [uncultured Sanguibacteroides sp.]|uniref:hypothetical protein n=1 Tax=uncultured Sanguibacteroides sp. TaxID=1635151 RepID=UPI0025D54067|nr:hypothetical protein [uncultured Sanguibacteroides sp.]
MDIITVKHSIPKHSCFAIVLPARGNYAIRCRLVNGREGELYKLANDGENEIYAELLDMFVYTLKELPESNCYWAYGMSKERLIQALMNKFPCLREDSEIELLLLRKCKVK